MSSFYKHSALFFTLNLALLFGLSSAYAQHSDIWVVSDGGLVGASPTDVETGLPVRIDATTGKFLFLITFGDGFGPFTVDDPGMQAELNALTSDGVFNYRAVGTLWFWDGTDWSGSSTDNETIVITDALGSMTTVSDTGITNPEGAIDFVSDGSVHQHVDFLLDHATSAPAVGAYMIDLEFFITDSVGGTILEDAAHAVRIAFNYQLPPSEFDAAVAALTAPAVDPVAVPIPVLFTFMLACLFVLVYQRIARPYVS